MIAHFWFPVDRGLLWLKGKKCSRTPSFVPSFLQNVEASERRKMGKNRRSEWLVWKEWKNHTKKNRRCPEDSLSLILPLSLTVSLSLHQTHEGISWDVLSLSLYFSLLSATGHLFPRNASPRIIEQCFRPQDWNLPLLLLPGSEEPRFLASLAKSIRVWIQLHAFLQLSFISQWPERGDDDLSGSHWILLSCLAHYRKTSRLWEGKKENVSFGWTLPTTPS